MRLSRPTLKLLRDVRRSRWQFGAVCVAIGLGVAIFIASYGSFQNLRSSYDRTYGRLAMADVWLEIDGAPATAVADVRALPGVAAVEGRLIAERPIVVQGLESQRILARLVSVPWTDASSPRASVNDVAVVEGSYFGSADDVLLDQAFARFNDIQVGDTLQVIPPTGEPLTLTVAGLVVSSEYLFAARNEQEMFTPPSEFGVIFLPYDTLAALLDRPGEVNDVAVRLAPAGDVDAVAQQGRMALAPYGVRSVTDREHQLSNRLLQLDLDGFRGLALVFPLLFLIVSSLGVYTLLSRLIQSQRGQIGVMRAMGYSRGAVLRHYLGFGVFVGVVGAVVGTLGGWLLSDLATRGYASSLNVPFVVVGANWALSGVGCVVGISVAVVASLLPAWASANIPPAEAMRAPTPARGVRSPLERLLPRRLRLPYALKLPLRNLSRVPKRSLYTALGIGAGVSLVLVGASLLDSFDSAINLQFKSIENYDLRVDFAAPVPASAVASVAQVDGVAAAEPIVELPIRLDAGGNDATVLLQGIATHGELLRTYAPDGRRIRPGAGLLVPETLASSLGVQAGDSVTVQPLVAGAAPVELRVDGVALQPLGSVIVTGLDTAGGLIGSAGGGGTSVLVQVAGRDAKAVQADLYDLPGVTTVQNKQETRDYIGQFSALFLVFVTIMLLFGVALGFAIIFNSITIGALERRRELATMRVIGTSLGRLLEMITVENALVAVLGVVLGLPFGLLVAHYFASLYQNDLIDMPLVIYTRTYGLAVAGAFLTVLFAEVPVVRLIRHLNLPAALRELTS